MVLATRHHYPLGQTAVKPAVLDACTQLGALALALTHAHFILVSLLRWVAGFAEDLLPGVQGLPRADRT